MTDTENVVSTLNDLLETSIDGKEGFLKAAEDVKDPTLKQYFTNRSNEVALGINELQSLVLVYGGEPTTTASIGGKLHRQWIDLKTAIASNDTVAVLNEVERGEDIALANYRKAIEKDLPENVRSVVQRQIAGVQRNHDHVKELRDIARKVA